MTFNSMKEIVFFKYYPIVLQIVFVIFAENFMELCNLQSYTEDAQNAINNSHLFGNRFSDNDDIKLECC